MEIIDFEYDGIRLSDKGYMMCYFGGLQDQVSNGSEITFAEVPIQYGVRRAVAGTSYDTVLQTTFCICKRFCPDLSRDQTISVAEVRDLARWLTRKEYLPFVLLADGYSNITYFGTFQIELIRGNSSIIGLQLTMTTNSPFGWQNEKTYSGTVSANGSLIVDDVSDEIGYLYGKMIVTCNSSGNLYIENSMDNGEKTTLLHCSSGETITFSHPIIEQTNANHDLASDFNYIFPKVSNTFYVTRNTFKFSLPCSVTFKYRPLAKIGV